MTIRFALAFLIAATLGTADFGGSKVDEVIRIRLDRGDLLLETILDVIKKHDVQEVAVLTVVGSLQ